MLDRLMHRLALLLAVAPAMLLTGCIHSKTMLLPGGWRFGLHRVTAEQCTADAGELGHTPLVTPPVVPGPSRFHPVPTRPVFGPGTSFAGATPENGPAPLELRPIPGPVESEDLPMPPLPSEPAEQQSGIRPIRTAEGPRLRPAS